MSDSYNSKFLDDPEFQSLLVGCLESLQRGETIDRQALAKDFPKYAAEIGKFLKDRQLLEQVASGFGDVEPSRVTISAYEQTIDSRSGKEAFAVGDSIVLVFEQDDQYDVLPFFWVPEEGAKRREKRDHAPYIPWIQQRYIEASPG